jgi:hypothetical protein
MKTRKTPSPPNPRRRQEKQNIQPFTMDKMTARKEFNWPKLCKSRNSGIL